MNVAQNKNIMEMKLRWNLISILLMLCIGVNCEKILENSREISNASTTGIRGKKVITMQIPGTPVRRLLDSRRTWLAFMRHSERTNRRHRAKNARKTKQLNGLRGPEGPPGPQGPPGPPGAEVTKDVMLHEFRNMVKEAAERRAQSILDVECEDCKPSLLDNITGPYLPPLFDVDEAIVIPKMIWGFHCRLEDDIKIPRKTLIELKGLHVPFVQGGFQRGDGINPAEGRFEASRKGIYNFVANLHVKHRSARDRGQDKKKGFGDMFRAWICISSLCQQNASLETIVQLTPMPWQGTVAISGLLELQKGQYVSIHVDNSGNDAVIILSTSYFTGSLVGL